jgi:catechol 2,3-dioxygenase-like lactoylglutathione lyase family enzyme
MNLNQVTLPAFDIPASVDFYRRLGFRLIVDAAHYARFECPEGDATLSVHQVQGIDAAVPAPNRPGVTVYFECADLDARVAALQADGIVFTQLPRDEPWLWREARLLDPAGNTLCLYFAGPNRQHPPWRVS